MPYDKVILMIIIGDKRKEFIGKMVSDLGKAVVTVALASYFFKEFPLWLRIGVTIFGFILLLVSIVIVPEEGGNK